MERVCSLLATNEASSIHSGLDRVFPENLIESFLIRNFGLTSDFHGIEFELLMKPHRLTPDK